MSITLVKRLAYSILVISLVQAVAVDRHDLRKRQTYEVQKSVVVVEQVNVFQNPDGSFSTAQAVPISTTLSLGTPALLSEAKATPPPQAKNLISTTSRNEEQPEDPEDPTLEEPITIDPASSPSPTPATSFETQSSPVTQPQTLSEVSTSNEVTINSNVPQGKSLPAAVGSEVSSKVAASSRAKRGIAYNDVTKLSAFTSSEKVSWAYNWGSSSPSIPNNIEYVPMLWGTGAHADGWHENANKALSSGSTHLLAFNEPDLGAQSSLSVSDAVAGYQKLMQPYAGKAKLGSPAVTNGAAPMGLSYLKEFITSCSGCTIDFVAIHWYNGGNAQDFKNYVTKAHEVSGGRPIWITEFEASGDAGQQQAFLNDVLPWLDNQGYVERYAYFMASDGNLISSGTTLSPVGQAFAFGN